MYMRLGFAVAIHVDPDVLLVDEVLAVGDEGFTHKCLDKFAEFRRRGKTILLVTHSLGLVERFCDEALWLDDGRLKGAGDPRASSAPTSPTSRTAEETQLADGRRQGARVGRWRSRPTNRPTAVLPRPPDRDREGAGATCSRPTEGRWGSREVEITDVMLAGRRWRTRARVPFRRCRWRSASRCARRSQIDDFVFGIGIFNADGVCCYGTNTCLEELKRERIFGDAEAVTFTIDSLDLVEGTYKLDVAVHKLDGYPYDYHRLLYTFRVKSRTKDVGIYRPRHHWAFSDGHHLQARATSSR